MIRPDFREIKAICNSENELLHYGVKGMRWGVRRRLRQVDRLDKKISKSKKKSVKNYVKAIKKGSRRFQTEISRGSSESAFKKGNKANRKLNQYIKKREKLFKNLEIILDEPMVKKKGLKSYSSSDQEALRREVENRRLPGEDRFIELIEQLQKKQIDEM